MSCPNHCTHALKRALSGAIVWAIVFSGTIVPELVAAQGLRIEPSVASSLIWSSNTDLGTSTNSRSDLILDVRPALRIAAGGPQLKLAGTIGLTSTTYTDGTQPNETAPQANLALNAVLVQRLLFLDLSVRSFQTSEDLFGVRTESTSTVNRFTTTQYAISPYIDREITPSLRLNLRSDNTWTQNTGSNVTLDDGYFARHSGRLALRPEPMGFGVEVERTESKFENAPEALTRDIGRLLVSTAFDAQLELSLIGGYERADIGPGQPEESGAVYGGRIGWRPSERTDLEATVEHRFFGTGWDASFTHRTPFMAWNLSIVRQVSSYTERLFSAQPGGDIGALLDAAFTTRFPDPTERARVIQEFLAQRGLSTTAQSAINLYSDRLDLYTSASGSIALIRPRDAASLTLYRSRIETLPGANTLLAVLLPSDVIQKGVTLNWSHRTTPQSAIILTLGGSRADGFNANAGERTKQQVYRIEYNQVLSPRTTALVGVRHQIFDSTVNPDGQESAAFIGLGHRF